MELIDRLVIGFRTRLARIDGELTRLGAPLSGGAISGLYCSRRIIAALEERLDTLSSCTGSLDRLGYAATILNAPLHCRHDQTAAVSGGMKIPSLTPDQWEPALESLVTQIEREIAGRRHAA